MKLIITDIQLLNFWSYWIIIHYLIYIDHIIDLNYNGNIETLKQIHDLINNVQWKDINQLHKSLKERELIQDSINEYFEIKSKAKKVQKKLD